MSYITPDTSLNRRLQIAEYTISGSPAANGYFTMTYEKGTFGAAAGGSGTTTLYMPAGHYMFRACLDITRTNSQFNYSFQFEVNGSLVGMLGLTGLYNNLRADVAEATYTAKTGFELRLEATFVESGLPTLTNSSKAFIWRID